MSTKYNEYKGLNLPDVAKSVLENQPADVADVAVALFIANI